MIANAVAGAELLVGVVVKHAPAEGTGNILLRGNCVQHTRMAQHMLQAVFFVVKGFGRIHVTAVFRDQKRLFGVGGDRRFRLTAGLHAVVYKVVIGVDVLQQLAVLVTAHAAGRSGGIEFMCRRVGAHIKIVVVLALVDADAPEDDGRVVAVFAHHLPDGLHRHILPRVVAEVLPAGDLGKDRHAQLVTALHKVVRLRIVRGSHRVAAELIFQNFRIEPLHGARHGVARVGIALVAVESAQLEFSAVEIKAVLFEFRLAEADGAALFVHDRAVLYQLGAQLIQGRAERVPKADVFDRNRNVLRRGKRALADNGAAVPLGDGQTHGVRVADDRQLTVNGAVKARVGRERQGVRHDRLGKNIVDIAALAQLERDLAVQSAVGHVVDHLAERRKIQRFTRVQLHRKERRRIVGDKLRFKGGVAALVLAKELAVQIDLGVVRRGAEADKGFFVAAIAQIEPLAVAADHLVNALVKIVIGDQLAGVRQAHGLAGAFAVEKAAVTGAHKLPVIVQMYGFAHKTPQTMV